MGVDPDDDCVWFSNVVGENRGGALLVCTGCCHIETSGTGSAPKGTQRVGFRHGPTGQSVYVTATAITK